MLVFVEVKLKIGDQYGSPEEMITPHKITQVQNTATAFLLKNVKLEAEFDSWRIDAVCIVLGEDKQILSLNHWENISF